MYARLTLVDVDTMRTDIDDAVELFRERVLPELRLLDGFAGVVVLVTDEGRGQIATLWETEDDASASAGFAAGKVDEFMTLYRSPPGREQYRVAIVELTGVPATP
jgi:hypothetical protein